MRHTLGRALTLVAGALAVSLGAGAVRAETVLSITQTAYDANDRPICSAVRMNLATTATDACALGTADTVNNWGADRISQTVYDADGSVVEVKRAVGTTALQLYATYTYTKNGQKASEADANGNVTRLVYDGFDRLETIYYPSPAVNHAVSLPCSATTETWCGGTQPYTVRITDTLGKPLLGVASTTDYERFGYDKNSNKTSWRRRNAQNKYYSYDSLNRVVHENGTTGPDIYTSYDLQSHVCDKILTTDTASSGNDCNARMTAVTTAGIHNSYDKAGRLLSTKDANARVVSYAYNEASQRTSMTYPDSVVEGYQYNVDGSLKWAGVNATTLGMTAGYDARGRLITVTRSNGANSTVGYDDMSRVLTLKHTVTNTANNADWAFIYNPASQVTKVTAPAAYEYVETVTGGYHPTYDGLNRDAGIANLTTTCGVDGDGYDCNGNLTNEGVGGRKFTYDIDNRLLTSTGGSAAVTLAYDPTGRLSSYTAGSLTTQFLYDGVNLIAEYQGGVMVKRYMHTTGTDQPFVEFTGTGTATGNAKFLLANYQGSIIALADSTGTVNLADVYKYGPYGEPVNNAGSTTWGGERFRYTGQIVLPEAELYYYKARVYDPKYGRFLQTDPVGSKDDLDLYAYVGGDPINHSDPTGLLRSPESIAREAAAMAEINRLNQEKRAAPVAEAAGNIAKGLLRWVPWAAPVVTAVSASPAGQGSSITDGRIPIYRVFGGTAGQYSKDDSTTGTFYALADPSQLGSKEAVRQDFALPPSWGNDLSKLATVYVNPSDVTLVGPAGSETDKQTGRVYDGGGIQVLVQDAKRKVIPWGVRPSGLQ